MILAPHPVPALRRLLAALLVSFALLCWGDAIRAQEPAPVHRAEVCPAGEPVTVVNGVYACLVDQGGGIESALRVYIAPGASGGKAAIGLRDLLEPAFYYCSGVEVPRDSGLNYAPGSSAPHSTIRFRTRGKISGSWAPSQCQIEFATAAYEAVETSFLQNVSGLDKSMKIEVDFNGSAIVHNISTGFQGDTTYAQLPECNWSRRDQFYRLVDARDWLDPLEGGGAEVRIDRIGPGPRAAGKWGMHPVRVRTASEHLLSDGNDRIPPSGAHFEERRGTGQGLGDVVWIQGTSHYDGYYLIQEVLDDRTFLIKTSFDPANLEETSSLATVRPAPATAWCSGSEWQSGKPVIYVGGVTKFDLLGRKVEVRRTDFVSIRSFSYMFDGHEDRYFFQRFVVLDANGGGVSHITVENLDASGHSELSGKVVVDLGGPVPLPGTVCESIYVRNIKADPIGSAWSAGIWNRSCSDSVIEQVHAEHGGAIWIGMDRRSHDGVQLHRPHNVRLNGLAEGINEGPGLVIWSGRGLVLSGWEIETDKDGPLGEWAQCDRGMLAIIGGHEARPVDLVTHGSYWNIHISTDLDCYVQLGRIGSWSWHGGHVGKGVSDRQGKMGRGSFACTHSLSEIGRIDWRNIAENHFNPDRSPGGGPLLLDLSEPPASVEYLAPNVEHSYGMAFHLAGELSEAGLCLSTRSGAGPERCGASGPADPSSFRGFWGSRLWVHELACWIPGEGRGGGWGPNDSIVLQVVEADGRSRTPLGPPRVVRRRDLEAGGFRAPVNAATARSGGGIAIEVTSLSKTGLELATACQLKVSDLVD